MTIRTALLLLLATSRLSLAPAAPAAGAGQDAGGAAAFRDRPPQDEVIYFRLPDRFENGDAANDRGGLSGGRLTTGVDPTSTGFYHGGGLKGLISRLG